MGEAQLKETRHYFIWETEEATSIRNQGENGEYIEQDNITCKCSTSWMTYLLILIDNN